MPDLPVQSPTERRLRQLAQETDAPKTPSEVRRRLSAPPPQSAGIDDFASAEELRSPGVNPPPAQRVPTQAQVAGAIGRQAASDQRPFTQAPEEPRTVTTRESFVPGELEQATVGGPQPQGLPELERAITTEGGRTIIDILAENATETVGPFIGIALTTAQFIEEEIDRPTAALFLSRFDGKVRDRARELRAEGVDTYNAALRAYAQTVPAWQQILVELSVSPINLLPIVGFPGAIARVSARTARAFGDIGAAAARVGTQTGGDIIRGAAPLVRNLIVDEAGTVSLPKNLSGLRIKRFLRNDLQADFEAARQRVEAVEGQKFDALAGLRQDEFFLIVSQKGKELLFEDFDSLNKWLATGEYVPASISSPIRTPGVALYEAGRIVDEPLGPVPQPPVGGRKGPSAKVEESPSAMRKRLAEKGATDEEIQITEPGVPARPFERSALEPTPFGEARAFDDITDATQFRDGLDDRLRAIRNEIDELEPRRLGARPSNEALTRSNELRDQVGPLQRRISAFEGQIERISQARRTTSEPRAAAERT